MAESDLPSLPDGAVPATRAGIVASVRIALRYIGTSPTAAIGLGIVVFWILVALLAPLIAPHNPIAIDYDALNDPRPNARYWLGTDQLGRDILSRIIWGARTVLTVAPLAVACAYIAGCAMGSIAAYYGGWIDEVLSRLSDVILSFPILVLYILLITTLGASAFNIVLAVTVASSPSVSRIVRGLVLDLRTRDYVAAARLRGENVAYIIIVEILPNAAGPLIVDSCLRLGWTIIAIGILGFLGLGLPPPDPDWGGMVREATRVVFTYPHTALFPSIAISSLVVGLNLLADGLRELARRD